MEDKKMKLNLTERYGMLYSLPVQEDIETLRIIRDLKMSLSPDEDECKEYGVEKKDGVPIKYDPEKAKIEKEIPIGEMATRICVKALKDANKAKRLTEQQISLYEKFIKD
jgi:hypothetical protein